MGLSLYSLGLALKMPVQRLGIPEMLGKYAGLSTPFSRIVRKGGIGLSVRSPSPKFRLFTIALLTELSLCR